MKEEYPKFINEFSNYLSAIKNYSNVYIKNLKITLKQFLIFINIYKFDNQYDDICDIDLNAIRSLNNSDIYSFIYFLAEKKYKQSSRTLKIEHLRTFFDYLFRIEKNIFKEPFKQIKRERNSSLKLPKYLSLEEARNLTNVYKNSLKFNEIRDTLILQLGLNCGLRVSEIANLKISDINFKTNVATILGKGNKERITYFNSAVRNALDEYMKLRNNVKNISLKDNQYLFINRYNKKVSIKNIQRSIKKAYKKSGLDYKFYTAHTLRHTCATLLYKAGVRIRDIQEVLGHVQIDTTEIYTHLYDKEVMDEMLSHPLAKFKIKDALTYNVA